MIKGIREKQKKLYLYKTRTPGWVVRSIKRSNGRTFAAMEEGLIIDFVLPRDNNSRSCESWDHIDTSKTWIP